MTEPHTYNHLDIKRYLQQHMSAQEMHAFEKALMDDPFLADAVEGFRKSDLPLADKHLDQVRKLVAGEKDEAKVVIMPGKKNEWWRVAAIVFVIATGSALTWSLLNNTSPQKHTATDMAAMEFAQPALPKDSIQPQDNALARNDVQSELFEKPAKTSTSPVIKGDFKNTPGIPAAQDNAKSAEVAMADKKEMDFNSVTSPAEGKDMSDDAVSAKPLPPAALQQLNEFKGKVTDDKGQPVAFANVRANNTATSTDADGKFSLKVPDTVIRVDVSSAGYDVAKAEIKNNAPANITLQQASESLSEVVVTSKLRAKKSVYAGATTKIEADKNAATGNAEPVGGWNNFRQYVNREVDSLETDEDEISDQSIKLEFLLDKKGRPTDIKVNEAPNKNVSEKAVEIIRNGPRWSNRSKEKRVKVAIPF